MQENPQPGGSATRWEPLFGGRARDWAETWEGPRGWGTPVYEHVLDRAKIGSGTRVLDCGCGAGRFARMAADRGASVAGIDAAKDEAPAARSSHAGSVALGLVLAPDIPQKMAKELATELPDEDVKNTDVDARFTAPGVQPEMVERGRKREKLKEEGKREVI